MPIYTFAPPQPLNPGFLVSGDVVNLQGNSGNPFRQQLTPVNGVTYQAAVGHTPVITGADIVTGWVAVPGTPSGRFVKTSWGGDTQQVIIDGVRQRQIGSDTGFSVSGYAHNDPAQATWPGQVNGNETTMAIGDFYKKVSTGELFIRPVGGTIAGKLIEVSTRTYCLNANSGNGFRLFNLTFRYSNTSATVAHTGVRILGNNITCSGLIIREMDSGGITLKGDNNRMTFCNVDDNGWLGGAITGRGCIWSDNTFNRNNNRGFQPEWSGAGMKCTQLPGMRNSQYLRNQAFWNWGNGHWWDLDCAGDVDELATIEFNTAGYNDRNGFFIEISNYARARHNYTYKNGQRGFYVNGANNVIEHNLSALNTLQDLFFQHEPRHSGPVHNKSFRNIFAWCTGSPHYTLAAASWAGQDSEDNLFVRVSGSTTFSQTGAGTFFGLAAWKAGTIYDDFSFERQLAIPPTLQTQINNEQIVTDWFSLLDLARDVNPSNPPGPLQEDVTVVSRSFNFDIEARGYIARTRAAATEAKGPVFSPSVVRIESTSGFSVSASHTFRVESRQHVASPRQANVESQGGIPVTRGVNISIEAKGLLNVPRAIPVESLRLGSIFTPADVRRTVDRELDFAREPIRTNDFQNVKQQAELQFFVFFTPQPED